MKKKMTSEEKLKGIRKAIRQIIAYPDKNESRRTEDGYPLELIFDEFAYKRIIDSYRSGLKNVLKDFK